MFEGESGLINTVPPAALEGGSWDTAYNVSMHQLRFSNGAMITGFSADQPNRMRGPNLTALFLDELAAYEKLQELWDVSRFALRKGIKPFTVITTTPKPLPLLFKMSKDPDVKVITGSTYDNLKNLSPEFIKTILAYEGTTFGNQEIHAHLLRDMSSAIFDRAWLRMWPAKRRLPKVLFLMTVYDTAYTTKTTGSDTAWITFAVCHNENTERRVAIVVDAGSGNIGYPALRKQVLDNWNAKRHDRLPDIALIEAKGAGLSLLSDFREEGVIMVSYMPTTDKALRGHTVSPLVMNGLLLFMEDEDRPGHLAPWARPIVNQLLLFPSADKDDLFDCITMGMHYLRDTGWLVLERCLPPDEEADIAEARRVDESQRINPYAA
jgi:predicted phage terminase large subunit-like protein